MSAPRRIPFATRLRAAVWVGLVLFGFALFFLTPIGDSFTKERVVALAGELRRVWWAPPLLVGLYIVMAPLGLPTGLLLVGGAVFGAWLGSVYNLTGLLLGAVLSYGLARLLGRDWVVHFGGERLRRAEQMFERHGFWPLVQTRFTPLPFAVVNFGAALAGVRFARFLGATALGLVPSTVIHTFFIATLFTTEGAKRVWMLVAYAAVFVLFNVLIGALWVPERARARWRGKVVNR